ncbi:glycosyltransferase family 9 protein [Candidatus Sumerlaeota bacterium]|nr:glycosyltransferase family 9 protein [Candidatus Sumerlaeota bacterium]
MIVQSDCRHYSGYRPCGKREDCAACPDYAPWAGQILVIKLAATGDVVRTTAILPGLHKHYHDHCITWLTDPSAIPILKTNPLINRLYPFTADGLMAVLTTNYSLLLNFEKEPRAIGFARLVTSYLRKGFTASRSGTPIAADSDSQYALQLGLSDELKFRINTKTYPQIIYEMAGLPYEGQEYVLELGDESLRFAEQFAQRIRSHLASSAEAEPRAPASVSAEPRTSVSGPKVIGINTGCGTVFPTKRWTVDGFVELIEHLTQLPDVRLVLLGGPLEVDLNRAILERVGQLPVGLHPASAGVFDSGCHNTLEQFLGIIECCDIVVSADSLAMHLAIARKKQVVALFGPTCHQEVDLFGRGEKIVTDFDCAPCYLTRCEKHPNCMEALRGATVADAVRRCIESSRAKKVVDSATERD